MSLKGRKVLVTGAGGFIGSHLCEALVETGAEVTALIRYSSRSDTGNLEFLPAEARDALRVVSGNVEDAEFIRRIIEGKEVVFHLAALIGIPYSYRAPRSYFRTNLEGTMNVLDAARAGAVGHVIVTSTSEVYGSAIYSPIDEKHPLQAQSPYAASKIAADKLAESYALTFGLPVSVMRPFNTFGPRQSARAVIPTIISQALTSNTIQLGALDPVRDMTFVKDTAAAFIALGEANNTGGQPVQIGTGVGLTIGDIAKRILSIMKVEREIVASEERIRPEKSEVRELVCDASQARALLGWQPRYSLDEGLSQTIEFISQHPSFYHPGRYAV